MPSISTGHPGERLLGRLAVAALLCLCASVSCAQPAPPAAPVEPPVPIPAPAPTAAAADSGNDALLQTHRAALYLDRATDESRVLAAQALLLSASGKASRIVVDALASDQPAVVRRAAAVALIELRHVSPTFVAPTALIDPLFAALTDKDTGVRSAAAGALASYDSDGVLTRLIEVAGGSGEKTGRLSAIRALGASVRKPAAAALVRLLRENDPVLRAGAVRSLIELTGHTEYGTDVTEWLGWWAAHENRSERQWERDLLRRKRWQAQQDRRRAGLLADALRQTIVERYTLLAPPEQIKLIDNYLGRDLPALNVAGALLIRRYVLAGGKVPEDVVQRLLLLVNHRESEVRAAAITALPDAGDGEVATAVLGRLGREATAKVRIAIAESAGRWAEPRAIQPMLGLLKDDQEAVVIAAVNALGAIATAHRAESLAAVEPLHKLAAPVAGGGTGRLWEAIILALGKIADARSVPVLMAAMKSTSAKTRLAAVVGLGRIAEPSVAAALTGYLNDADTGVREQVIRVLAALGSPEVLPALDALAVAPDTAASIKTQLLETMIQILRRQEKALLAAGDNDSLVGVRRRLAQTLVKRGSLNEALALYVQCAEQLKEEPALLADLQRERLWVLLTADQDEAFAALLADVLATADEASKQAIREKLTERITARLAAGELKSMLTVLEQVASKVRPEAFGEGDFAAWLAAQQRETAGKIAAADRKLLAETLERLTSADDAVWKAAAEALRARGKPVIGDLLRSLKADIEKNPGQPLFQSRIFDILKPLSAERYEYDPQAEDAERLKAIDTWLKALEATPIP